MILDISLWPDPILSTVCQKVSDDEIADPKFGQFCLDLIETMNAKNGVGLAAPQVGVAKRVFAVKTLGGDLIMINPIVGLETGTTLDDEGCLSIPGVYNQVARSASVSVQYTGYDEEGGLDTFEKIFRDGKVEGATAHWENIPARIIQHENDHLDGIMFFNRMSKQMRKWCLREWDKKNGK